MHDLRRHIVDVPDFPRPGILFRDITPLLRTQFASTLDALEALFDEHEWSATDALAGVESRGFILAAGLAARRGKGFRAAPAGRSSGLRARVRQRGARNAARQRPFAAHR